MSAARRAMVAALILPALGVALSGCPLKLEREPSDNQAPITFFETAPPDTIFSNSVFIEWLGTDRDSDVVAYQYQLVSTDSLYYYSQGAEGEVLRSLEPPSASVDPLWSDRFTDSSDGFSDLDDGWYEFRVRAIDAAGAMDPNPARTRFYVFFDDVSPECEIIGPGARLDGETTVEFLLDASDLSRNSETPREALQYSYQLRAKSTNNCSTHLTDPFTDWELFPSGDAPVSVVYNNLADLGCTWEFKHQVKDPAGQTVTCVYSILQNGN